MKPEKPDVAEPGRSPVRIWAGGFRDRKIFICSFSLSKMNWKKISVFIVTLILVILLSNLLFKFILPIKPVRTISQNMEPTYSKNDVLFYIIEENYDINEIVILKHNGLTTVTRIISINSDGTYEATADNNLGRQLSMEKRIPKSEIQGKILFSINPYIFYISLLVCQIIISFLLSKLIYLRLVKKQT